LNNETCCDDICCVEGESYCCANNGPIPYRCCPNTKPICCKDTGKVRGKLAPM